MRFLPVFLDLAQGAVGLAGSGPAAQSKLRLLRSAGARVRWFAKGAGAIEDDLAADLHSSGVEISRADPRQADFSGLIAVVSAIGDARDDDLAAQARRQRVPVNVVDRPDLSTFIFPAIVDRGEVVVAIGTGGAAPVLARRLRERIEALLPARIGDLAALMGRFRAAAARKRRGADSLRQFWERVVDGPIGATALAGRWHEAETALARATERPVDWHGSSAGAVFLVGSGPGDPDLLTLRALQALQGADVVLYDETVTAEILDRARRDAERIFVGRRAGGPGISQDAINRRLADAARQGRNAVHLKGGDPFSFARGGEEIDYLRHVGVAVVVVPGVTAALARAAVAALPPASEIAA
jgi:uroporphyrin-III C-methyltransferase / precorrin-2 dehydrogenase / sirohydrochlorin ferrochelatase